MANEGGFPHFHQQQNRRVAGLAAHSNGLLSKFASTHAIHHKLPGRIPGRGALEVTFGSGDKQVLVLSVHLSLSHNARKLQLQYIAELVKDIPYFIIMGDMNCPSDKVSDEFSKLGIKVKQGRKQHPTFPRWNPKHCFDQIWVSDNLKIIKSEVLDLGVSDHLPVAMEIELPDDLPKVLLAQSNNEQTAHKNSAIPKSFLN